MEKTRHGFRIALALAVLFGTAATPYAQEVVTDNDTGVGARAMGMGGAQIGAVNDVTAIIHNPAALARLNRTEVQLGLNLSKRQVDTRLRSVTHGYGDASAETDFSGLGTLGIAYPVPVRQGSLVIAAAYNRVKDFSGRFRVDGYTDDATNPGFLTGESIEDGGLGVFSLAGAVDVSPHVSIGASLDLWSGNYRRDNRQLLNDPSPSETYSQLDINGVDHDITAVSFKPAFLFFRDAFRLGGYIRLPMTFRINERFYDEGYVRNDGQYFRLYEIIDTSSPYNDIDDGYVMDYKIKAPMQLGFGTALGRPGSTMIAFDVSYENWKEAEIEYPAEFLPDPNYFLDKYRSVVSWRVGFEQPLPFNNSVVRAGYMRNPITFKGPRSDDEGASFISVSNERDFLTLGFGMQFDQSFGLDVAYSHGFWSADEDPRSDEESRNSLHLAITYRSPK